MDKQYLSNYVKVNQSFQKAMRLDSDFSCQSTEAIENYVPQGTALNVLRLMAEQIQESSQRAFTWTGPYGSGKSSLALVLCSLVGGKKTRELALNRLNLDKEDPILRIFGQGDLWKVYPLTGRQSRLIDDVAKLFRSQPDEAHVVDAFKRRMEKAPGLLLIIDELGKYLEAECATENAYLLQELAEIANRSGRKAVVVGILHQAVDVYASRLPKHVRDEWDKVKGRYSDMPILGNSEEVLELLGQAIKKQIPTSLNSFQKAADRVAREIARHRHGDADKERRLATLLFSAWPLNPVLSVLLGPISRRKFSQNERSIYSFLNSHESLGFQEFISSHTIEDTYAVSDFWDYLKTNYESSILSTSESHRWMTAVDAVERTERRGTSSHIRLIKTLAIVDLFRAGSGLEASLPILTAGTFFSEKKAKELLKDLLEWKVIIPRHHLDAYAVFEGSDFNLEQALSDAEAKQNGIDITLIEHLLDLTPIVARNLYMRVGTLRWFDRVIVPQEQLAQWLEEKGHLTDGAAGAFVLVIPEQREETPTKELLLSIVEAYKDKTKDEKSLIFGVPSQGSFLRILLVELQALHQVAKVPELEGDETGRKELMARTNQTRDLLKETLSSAFSKAQWYHPAVTVVSAKRQSDLNVLASNVAEGLFSQVPEIKNELINRDFLSTNVSSARKSLMKRMLAHETEKNLGYESYPPDYALFLAMLKSIHFKNENGQWYFNINRHSKQYSDFWDNTKKFLSGRGNTTCNDLYAFWRKQPYGLKYGPMPILALAFCLSNRNGIAVYQNKAFIPEITEQTIDEWIVEPRDIAIRLVEESETSECYLKEFATVMTRFLGEPCESKPLAVARALVKLFMLSPKWAQHSTSYSSQTNQLKQTVLKASDPIKLLCDDIPAIYSGLDATSRVKAIESSIQEYQTAMPVIIDKTRELLLKALKASPDNLLELHSRATAIRGLSGKMLIEAFISRLEKFENSREDIEGLISLAAAKPSFQWTDNDIRVAHTKLADFSYEFRKLEATSSLRNRPIKRRVFNVVFGGAVSDLNQAIDLSDEECQKATDLAKNVRKLLAGSERDVALAALVEAGLMTMKEDK